MKCPTLLLILLIVSFVTTSCRKQFSLDPVSQTNLVKTYTEDFTSVPASTHTVVTYNLSYDAGNRLMSIVSTTSPGDKFVYQYNSNNTFTLDIYNSNVVSIHELFFINSLSLIDSSFQYNDTKDSSTEKYFYNPNKQLITTIRYKYSAVNGTAVLNTSQYTWDTNGNMTQDTDNITTLTYTYYSNLLNTLVIGTPYDQQNKYLVKTVTSQSGSTTETVNYTYTFDSYNRLTTQKGIASNGDVIIKTYTY